MPKVSPLDTSYDALQEFWNAEEKLPEGRPRQLFRNTLIAYLSGLVPAETWRNALTRARQVVHEESTRKDGILK